MSIADLQPGARALELSFVGGGTATYPYIWLRDNCPAAFHPDTEERVLDLLSVDAAPRPDDVRVDGDALVIAWAGEGHESRFPTAWLRRHRPGQIGGDDARIPPTLWRHGHAIGRHAADAILADDAALRVWLSALASTGLTIVEGVGGVAERGVAVAERVGFLRRTNFGTTFEVRTKPDPNNLAYTSEALPLHTDLPNQEVPPGYQFLHCLKNGASGGGSVFADGFAIAEDLRTEDPEAFALLRDIDIPFRFHDRSTDIRVRRPVITCDREDRVIEIRWNAHLADVFDMGTDVIEAYYRAYRAMMERMRQPRYQLTVRLAPREMVVFDNRRVLHGREAFDPTSGERHLHGHYVDRGEVDARIRMLGASGV
ncbi:MAG: TauD/TfdA family dioxygenase [Pseudomonadota bacterium]